MNVSYFQDSVRHLSLYMWIVVLMLIKKRTMISQ